MLITFEGGDGAGKTSQIPILAEWLREKTGLEVVCTKEPGGTALGTKLRELLLAENDIASLTELLLFMADRAQHVQTVIRPAVVRGAVVLCDRYIDSTIAYQGYGRGRDLDLLQYLNTVSTGALLPNRTLLFDVSIETGLNRATVKTKFEGLGREFQERVLDGFRTIACSDRFRRIDANQDFANVTEQAKWHISELLGIH